jgi:hypothetical protein
LVTLALSLVVALLAVFVYSVVQRYVIVHDDYVRGNGVRELAPLVHGSRNPFCEGLAESLYGHDLFVLSGNSDQGFAPPNEKAFYSGCTGEPFSNSD